MEILSRLLNRVVDGDFIPGFQVGDGFGRTLKISQLPFGDDTICFFIVKVEHLYLIIFFWSFFLFFSGSVWPLCWFGCTCIGSWRNLCFGWHFFVLKLVVAYELSWYFLGIFIQGKSGVESTYRKREGRLPRWKKLLSVELPVCKGLARFEIKVCWFFAWDLIFLLPLEKVLIVWGLRLNANSKFDVRSFIRC